MRSPRKVFLLGSLLLLGMAAALWWTAEPATPGELEALSEGPPLDAGLLPAPPEEPRRTLDPVTVDAGGQGTAGPRPEPPTLPREQWPERFRPTSRRLALPRVEDAGPLRTEEVQQAIDSARPLLSRCFTDAAEKNFGDQRAELRFTVKGGSGRFEKVELMRSTIVDPWVHACFVDALEDAQFPAPTGAGTVTLTLPFAFTAPDGGP